MTNVAILPPNQADWVRMIPNIERCGEEFEGLLKRYGSEVFAVNCIVFTENMPEALLIRVEQLRFQNARYLDSEKVLRGSFTPQSGNPAADGKLNITDKIENPNPGSEGSDGSSGT